MDVFTKKKRSDIMSRIRSKNTKSELFVFSQLRKRSIYFQKHYKKAIGSPDIALPSKKIAVFIDGDFWHGYKFKKQRQRLPEKYWVKKINTNVLRDKEVNRRLKKEGWKILRIWEHSVRRNTAQTIYRIEKFLTTGR